MKIHRLYTFTLITLTSLFFACDKDTCIHGDGAIITQEVYLEDFSAFKLSGSFNVVLKQGNEIKVMATGQQNIINEISRDIDNGVWDLKFKDGCYNNYTLTLEISHPSIAEFGINGSGNIHILNKLEALENLSIYNNGSGQLFSSDSILIENYLNVEISGSGSIDVMGEAINQNVNISGSGNYFAFELNSENASISIPGSGNAEINVDSTLSAFIGGSGNIYYTGNPDITSSITGSGELINSN